jgi:hypothetical protein
LYNTEPRIVISLRVGDIGLRTVSYTVQNPTAYLVLNPSLVESAKYDHIFLGRPLTIRFQYSNDLSRWGARLDLDLVMAIFGELRKGDDIRKRKVLGH